MEIKKLTPREVKKFLNKTNKNKYPDLYSMINYYAIQYDLGKMQYIIKDTRKRDIYTNKVI